MLNVYKTDSYKKIWHFSYIAIDFMFMKELAMNILENSLLSYWFMMQYIEIIHNLIIF